MFEPNHIEDIKDIIQDVQPKKILELSVSGLSSLLKEISEDYTCIESDECLLNDDCIWIQLIEDDRIEIKGFNFKRCRYYLGLDYILRELDETYDMIVVNGPDIDEKYEFGDVQLLSLIDYVNPNGALIVSYANNPSIKRTLNLLERTLKLGFKKSTSVGEHTNVTCYKFLG